MSRLYLPRKEPGQFISAGYLNKLAGIAERAQPTPGSYINRLHQGIVGGPQTIVRAVIVTEVVNALTFQYTCQIRYYDGAAWQTDTEQGPFDLDGSEGGLIFSVNDTLTAVWSEQRDAWIPATDPPARLPTSSTPTQPGQPPTCCDPIIAYVCTSSAIPAATATKAGTGTATVQQVANSGQLTPTSQTVTVYNPSTSEIPANTCFIVGLDKEVSRWVVSGFAGGAVAIAGNALLDGNLHLDTKAGTVVAGDLIRGSDDPTAVWERLAAGTNGHILTLVGGKPEWAANGGGSGGVGYAGKFTFAESAWTNTGSSETINLGYTLAAKEVVDTVMMYVNTAYTGVGKATEALVNIQASGVAAGAFFGGGDAMTAGSHGTQHFSTGNAMGEFDPSSTNVMTIQLAVDVGGVDQFTAGTFDIHLWTRTTD